MQYTARIQARNDKEKLRDREGEKKNSRATAITTVAVVATAVAAIAAAASAANKT